MAVTQMYQAKVNGIQDISDWFDNGGTPEELRHLCSAAPVYAPPAALQAYNDPIMTRLDRVEIKPLEWLWQDRIPLGKITLLAGDPSLGKSFLTMYMAAVVTRGGSWPDDPRTPAPKGSAILMNAEDDLEDTITPRLIAAHADLSMVTALEARQGRCPDGKIAEASVTLADLETIERAIHRTKEAKLVVVDPVSAYLGKSDSDKNADIRSLLAPLARIANAYHVAVVLVSHLSKGSSTRAIYRAMGSLAFMAAARAAYLLVADPHDHDRRLFLPVKNNLARGQPGLAFRIVDGTLDWEVGMVETTADEALLAEENREGGQKIRDDCKEWLRELLSNGPIAAKQVAAEAKAAGYLPRTLRRAREELPIKVHRLPGSTNSPWLWALTT